MGTNNPGAIFRGDGADDLLGWLPSAATLNAMGRPVLNAGTGPNPITGGGNDRLSGLDGDDTLGGTLG